MLFEENVLRSIGEIDKALLYLRRTVKTRRASGDKRSLHSIVQSSDVLSEIIVQAAIVDEQGIIRWSNATTESTRRSASPTANTSKCNSRARTITSTSASP
jgi:hypothetical protein